MKRSLLVLVSLAYVSVPQHAHGQAPASPSSPVRSETQLSETTRSEAAQAPSTEAGVAKVRRAQSHFQRGVQLYEEQNYEGALAEFSRAHELVPNYRILYNLAQTHVERHDYVEAVRLFGEYLEQGGSEIPATRRLATARERDGLLERIATVQIESNVRGAELWVDGRSRGVVLSSHALRLNSGHSALRLQKPDYEPVTRELTLAGGDSVVLDMKLERVSSPALALASDEAQTASGGASNTGLWVSAAATTLLAGATATFAILTSNENRELGRELDRVQADSTNLDDARSRVRTLAALTDGFGIAAVLALGSTLYFAASDSGNDESIRRSPAEAARAPGIQLLVGKSSVVLRGDF